MIEIEIKPGLFITPINRENYERNLMILMGDLKEQYIERANRFDDITPDGCMKIFGMSLQILTLHIWAKTKEFDPRTDFLYIRYDPKPTLFKEPATRSV